MMKEVMKAVHEFQSHMKVSPNQNMPQHELPALRSYGKTLQQWAFVLEQQLHKNRDDLRILRAHLMLEELGEVIQAMGDGDELAVLDGLSDLLYVLVGTAVTFRLPLHSAFWEVHRSNMTKQPKNGERLRDKGPAYVPPNLYDILVKARSVNDEK
jgi:predicted HAD superfamily Cof-like phosphohydrolase